MNFPFLKSLVLFLLCLLYFQAQAQEYYNRIGFNAGISFSGGDFADTEFSDENSGYANNGPHIHINYYHAVTHIFDLTAQFGASRYTFNEGLFKDSLRIVSGDESAKVETDSYQEVHFILGARFELETVDFDVYATPQIGYAHMDYPRINTTVYNQKKTSRSTSDSWAIIYGFNFGIDYFLTDRIALNLNLQYLTGTFEIEQVDQEAIEQRFVTFCPTVGIGYQF